MGNATYLDLVYVGYHRCETYVDFDKLTFTESYVDPLCGEHYEGVACVRRLVSNRKTSDNFILFL